MTFAKKIFLSLFLATMLSGSLFIWSAYHYSKKHAEEKFISRYSKLTKDLSEALTRRDLETEEIMLSAAKVVQAKDEMRGLLSTNKIRDLRDDLKMTHIFVIDSSGQFVRSTNEDVGLIPNLFSFCPDYVDLVRGKTNAWATPVVQPNPEPRPFKFVLVPSVDRKRIIEVGIRVDFIGKTLVDAVKSDTNIVSMSLYSPNGAPFGQYDSNGADFRQVPTVIPTTFPKYIDNGDSVSFFSRVASSHPKCCQCDVAGTSRNGEYYYVLESKVSKGELKKILAATSQLFLFFGVGNVIIALLLSQFLARRLVRNIKKAVEKIRNIKNSGDVRDRLDLKGRDEVAYLTSEFDHLLDKLEASQARALASERVQAKVQIARDVAHNIRSPVLALEMMLPALANLPTTMQKTIKSAVREIKSLADKLNREASALASPDKEATAKKSVIYLPILIEEMVSQKRLEYSQKPDIQLEFIRQGDVKYAFVLADSLELKSILSNLINNAAEAYTAGGRISVSLSMAENECEIAVTDFGVGIPKEFLNELGRQQITFKGNNDRGLGLVHAFSVLESWGGKVEIKSELGKGTSVILMVPGCAARESTAVDKMKNTP